MDRPGAAPTAAPAQRDQRDYTKLIFFLLLFFASLPLAVLVLVGIMLAAILAASG